MHLNDPQQLKYLKDRLNRNGDSSPSRGWLIAPIAGAGLFVACLIVLLTRDSPSESVHSVRGKISEIILHRSTKPGVDNGGPIGPWWVSASDVDQETGAFRNFRISTENLHIAAETAELTIDPINDSFSFTLKDIVLVDLEDMNKDEQSTGLQTMASHTLGPIEYGVDIVEGEPPGDSKDEAPTVAGAPTTSE